MPIGRKPNKRKIGKTIRVKKERTPRNLSKITLKQLLDSETGYLGWGRTAKVRGKHLHITYRNGRTARFSMDGKFKGWVLKK